MHHAVSGALGSHHVTLSLQRQGTSWQTLVTNVARRFLSGHAEIVIREMRDFVQTPGGLELYNALPMWVLTNNSECMFLPTCFDTLCRHYTRLLQQLQEYMHDHAQSVGIRGYHSSASTLFRRQLTHGLAGDTALRYGLNTIAGRVRSQQIPESARARRSLCMPCECCDDNCDLCYTKQKLQQAKASMR